MKKALFLVVVLALVVGLLPGSLIAEGEPTLVLNGASTVSNSGEGYYDLTVSLENNPGIVSIRYDLSWDATKFDLVKAVYAEDNILEDLPLTAPPAWKPADGSFDSAKTLNNPATFYFKDFTTDVDSMGDGDVMVYTFKLKAGVAVGETAVFGVALTATGSSLQKDMTKVDWAAATKTVTVIACEHEWVDPTCTEPKTCSKCGETEGSANGHTWVAGTVVAPTCTADGYTPYTCSVCSETKTDDVTTALGHDPQDTVVPPTCTEGGITNIKCSRCQENLGTKDPTSAIGHDWDAGTITTDPTCTTLGVKTFNCNNGCGTTKTEDVPMVAHTMADVVTAPTCTDEGYTLSVCSVCGYTDNVKTNIVDALGHNYIATVVAPTCIYDGYTVQACSRCGLEDGEKTNIVPATGEHIYGEDGHCIMCGQEAPGPVDCDHVWFTVTTSATCGDPATSMTFCLLCGEGLFEYTLTALPTGEHRFSEDGYCTICGVADCSIEGNDHTVFEWVVTPTCVDGYSVEICSSCVKEIGERYDITEAVDEHNYVNGYCSVCGQKEPVDTSDSNSIFATTSVVSLLAAAAVVLKKKLS